MTFKIVTADERMARTGIKGQIWGRAGIGKTSLLLTLPPESTLVLDFEAGLLAIGKHPVDSVPVKTWDEARNLACWIGGPNRSMRSDQSYSEAHYAHVCTVYGDPAMLDRYETIFIDSTTIASQKCFQWATGQPEAFSDKTGKPDTRGAYGLHGREMLAWLSQLQHCRAKNIVFVGILDQKEDDYGRTQWVAQIDGSKVGRELPGIVDQVITYQEIQADDGSKYRGLVCQSLNPFGYPAKDRSGRLDMIERPHLGDLFAKIKAGQRKDALATELPNQAA